MQGDYYGAVSVETLAPAQGDTGLGTFDALDGEMVVLDGVVYKAAYDGSITAMGAEALSPFVNVAFIGDGSKAWKARSKAVSTACLTALNALAPDHNMPVVFRVAGTYQNVEGAQRTQAGRSPIRR